MPDINRTALLGAYARLKGLERSIAVSKSGNVVDISVADDFQAIVQKLSEILEEDLADYHLAHDVYNRGRGLGRAIAYVEGIIPRLFQLIHYLETVHHLADEVIEIGTLYNAIKDEELRGRVADLLTAPSNFDRAINQATQVLEDRIRTKSGDTSGSTGTTLVNSVIKQDPSQSILKVSDDPSEQDGFANLCRGMMLAFRNPTHHKISDRFSREDALKVCGFVDNLLALVDDATVKT